MIEREKNQLQTQKGSGHLNFNLNNHIHTT